MEFAGIQDSLEFLGVIYKYFVGVGGPSEFFVLGCINLCYALFGIFVVCAFAHRDSKLLALGDKGIAVRFKQLVFATSDLSTIISHHPFGVLLQEPPRGRELIHSSISSTTQATARFPTRLGRGNAPLVIRLYRCARESDVRANTSGKRSNLIISLLRIGLTEIIWDHWGSYLGT